MIYWIDTMYYSVMQIQSTNPTYEYQTPNPSEIKKQIIKYNETCKLFLRNHHEDAIKYSKMQ